MYKNKIVVSLFFVSLLIALPISLYAANGQLQGKVTDNKSGEPLPGANVVIQGTSLGSSTDIEGKYRIRNVPPGNYTLVVTYLGYEKATFDVGVRADEATTQNAQLNFEVIEGEAVEVTAQLEGQLAAINQQMSSNTIVNVVSKERIRELPDDNAAESVSRLPGVAVRRNAGEGSRVNIRGMSSKFNAITVDGERIPSTGQGRKLFNFNPPGGGGNVSTLTEDRSVDLSVISAEALQGIEVFKALTPDKDADAIGGSVNFVTGKARPRLQTRLNVIGAYTGYHESFENLKLNGSISNRLFDDKLGVLFTGAYQRADRSSDNQQANWSLQGSRVRLSSVELDDFVEKRDRINFNLNLDYSIGDHSEVRLTNFFSRTDRDIANREYSLSLTQNDGDYAASWSKPTIYVYSSNLTSQHNFQFAELDWGFNYITTVDENDFNYGYSFMEPTVFRSQDFIENEGPFAASQNTRFTPEQAWGGTPWGGGTTKREDKNWSARINLKKSFSFSNDLAAYVKVGGKHRAKERTLEQTGLKIRPRVFLNRYIADNPDAVVFNEELALSNFQGAFEPGDFFYGDHFFPITLDHKAPYRMFQQYQDLWKRPVVNEGLNDYIAEERISAGYFQAELNWKGRVTFLGGARYEYENNDYTGVYRTDITELYEYDTPQQVDGVKRDTSGTRKIGKWFPQAHLRIGLLRDAYNSKGLDLRLAYTRTITRPEFLLVTPRFHIQNGNNTIYRGRTDLNSTTSWNTDVFLTAYSNLGMITVGYFHKDLTDVVFEFFRRLRPGDELYSDYRNWFIVDPQNSNADNTARGWEFELQTNFSWLPSPFDGIVLYGNYSRIRSEVHYPWNYVFFDPVTFQTIEIDSTRTESLPGQADNILNLSLGYDKGGFSGRLSYYFQDETISFITNDEKVDGYTDGYARLDFSASYKITSALTAILNINNILNRKDRTFVGIDNLVGGESIYGTRSEFGLRYDIR